MKPKKIIVAGGGTGGHIFPAVAIANAIKALQPDTIFLFVGAKGKMEMEKVPQAGYAIEGLDIAGFNRSSLLKNFSLPIKIIKSFFQVNSIFKSFKPDAVIGVGGYSSFPVLKLAQQKGISSFIHESNSFAGKSNMLLGKLATQIFVATDGMEKFFPKDKIIISGNPVRHNIAQSNISREEGIRLFGLNPNKKTVLSIGGSLGAKSINEAIQKEYATLIDNDIQIIWQTGKPFAEKAKVIANKDTRIWTSDFIREMDYAYAAADLIVSRSGAMSIAEIETVGKPSILVPYPFAAENHQTVNAQQLVDKHAAVLIPDEKAIDELIPEIVRLLNDQTQLELLSKNTKLLAKQDADILIAKKIIETISK
ncbi:MAG: undecaprenyldiphospho-muramoylpentapeptide beta-N-acetylglucosaminyltransferase [Chitinophagaceae bacterium]|nr:undecaprenyldiphospho-muramoylpentapeptide beta-N-acetylglucosaminyltransferase [Chitinophagaceae bacterium]